ncbi:MAG: site-specific integrase [Colwellia sp.]
MMVKIEKIRLESGEDLAMLVDPETGTPLTYPNLFITAMYRNRSKAVSYCETICRDLKLFFNWLGLNYINLIDRFTKSEYFLESEIERLVDDFNLTVSAINHKYIKKRKKPSKIINFRALEKNKIEALTPLDAVDSKTAYTRLMHITSYLKWLSSYLRNDTESQLNANTMVEALKVRMPEVTFDNARTGKYRALPEIQLRQLLDIVRPEHPKNIWVDESIRFRNYVLINFLTDLGTRKGELLNTKTHNLDIQKSSVVIARDPDNPKDTRRNRPAVKTLGRDLDITPELADDIDIYIHHHRAKINGADRTEYIFITHKAGPYEGEPLSISSVKKIFSELSRALGFKVSAHDLRHTNADLLYEGLEDEMIRGILSEAQVEEALCYTFGWKDGSAVAKRYTQRARDKLSREKQLELQKRKRLERDIGGYDDDFDY